MKVIERYKDKVIIVTVPRNCLQDLYSLLNDSGCWRIQMECFIDPWRPSAVQSPSFSHGNVLSVRHVRGTANAMQRLRAFYSIADQCLYENCVTFSRI